MYTIDLGVDEQRRILIQTRTELEKEIIKLCASLGVDYAASENIAELPILWSDEESDTYVAETDPEKHVYDLLTHLIGRFMQVVNKLEGPNRLI